MRKKQIGVAALLLLSTLCGLTACGTATTSHPVSDELSDTLIRGKHSFEAIAKIRDTTQLFLDVYSDAAHVFVKPLKVWNRYSETMFLPHQYDKETGFFRSIMGKYIPELFQK